MRSTSSMSSLSKYDNNGNGIVCVPLKSGNNVKDDQYYLVW